MQYMHLGKLEKTILEKVRDQVTYERHIEKTAICPFCATPDATLGLCIQGVFVGCPNSACKVNNDENEEGCSGVKATGRHWLMGREEDQETVLLAMFPEYKKE